MVALMVVCCPHCRHLISDRKRQELRLTGPQPGGIVGSRAARYESLSMNKIQSEDRCLGYLHLNSRWLLLVHPTPVDAPRPEVLEGLEHSDASRFFFFIADIMSTKKVRH